MKLTKWKIAPWTLLVAMTAAGQWPIGSEAKLPSPRVSNILQFGEWQASPIVAVGEISNVKKYGEQTVDHLPPPTSVSIHKLYWCLGDFHVVAVVKGEIRVPSREYIWATTFRDCNLWPPNSQSADSRAETRAWFLREENGVLRPTFDYGTHKFLGLLTKWEDGPPLPAPERLGVMLLTPSANSETLEDFSKYLWDIGGIACEFLGKAECARRVGDLLSLHSTSLADAACHFLKDELQVDCHPQ